MSKSFKKNSKKQIFLDKLPSSGIETSNVASRCHFNFSYFSPDNGGQSWEEWNIPAGSSSLESLAKKLVHFTNESLKYWEEQRAGAGGLKVLTFYPSFPNNTLFDLPKSVPHDVKWGRFRLGNKVRLAGFRIPTELDGKLDTNGNILSADVFYLVFLDKNHEFWTIDEAD